VNTTEALATVREAITDWSRDTREWKLNVGDVEAAHAFLAAELKRLRTPAWDRLAAQEVKRLEAELERVKAERDAHYKAHDEVDLRMRDYAARLDKALAALRLLRDFVEQDENDEDEGFVWMKGIIHAAIAEIEGEKDE
jgi:hypothetical protein